MSNTQVNITKNGTTTLATAGKYCNKNIDVNVSDPRFKGLIERTLTEISDEGVERVGDLGLSNYDNLISVDFPNATSFGEYAIFDCNNLTTLNAPKLETMGRDALRYDSKLTSVNFPLLKEVPQYGLYYCVKLTSAHLPAVENIGAGAFGICIEMRQFELPKVKSIGASAFYDCRRLRALIIGTTDCTLEGSGTFNQTPIAGFTDYTNGQKGYIYVPDDAVETYKTATNWSVFADNIRPISEWEG